MPGFFRTHLGLESIQPRENITTSIAVTSYYEPYYLSGAKLTYYLGSKVAIQGSVFNGFNTFIENNKNKTFGLSMIVTPNDKLSITLNSLSCDEKPDNQVRKQPRIYTDLYLSYKNRKLDIGAEANYGSQKNSGIIDTSKTENLLSFLLVARYHVNKKLRYLFRGEYFDDKAGILTGPMFNHLQERIGINLWGYTGGINIAPILTPT